MDADRPRERTAGLNTGAWQLSQCPPHATITNKTWFDIIHSDRSRRREINHAEQSNLQPSQITDKPCLTPRPH